MSIMLSTNAHSAPAPTHVAWRRALIATAVVATLAEAQQPLALPLRQSTLDSTHATAPLTLRDVSRNDRFIGVGVRDVRWAPDGSGVYFRWNAEPKTTDDPEADPWYRVDRDGRRAWRVPDSAESRPIRAGSSRW